MGSNSDSSEDESPEVISSVQMKSEREKEIREIFTQKKKVKEELKLKRKLKAEILKLQKKEKLARKQLLLQQGDSEDEAVPESVKVPVAIDSTNETKPSEDVMEKSESNKRTHSKIYPKYNIVVESLTKVQDTRAAAALSFKEKRLAKVPRENCASTVLSYREKILAKKTSGRI